MDGYDKEDELLRTRRPISRDQIIRLRKVIIPDEGDPWMLYGYDVPLSAWPALDEILHCGPPIRPWTIRLVAMRRRLLPLLSDSFEIL
ncbi:hypothetical protein SSP531S_59660 [Streptomyces spongiicola]|uniref:DUF7683 domain-containing protein n=1 Tax=Streptomyces spongiicola TaxID=1690221 RepID=A0A388T6T8_9ACTN|nr:hypothetical protein SSP531S_59660 [Streptomyces spongiicola]